GAFYGPKVDLYGTDSIGRKWQLGTIQLDYNAPERFALKYVGEDNAEHQPVVIHRAVSGSFERFIAILIEHFAGAFPVWLAPEQVRVLPISNDVAGVAETVTARLKAAGVRASLDNRSDTLNYRMREGEEVIFGNVIQGGVGQAPARQALIKSGIPASVSAVTINKVCGSGLKAVMLAAQAIKAGDRQCIVAGGQESMSNAPFYVYGMRNGVKLGDQQLVDGMIRDGLWCSFCDVHMGSHAEYTAKKAGVSREMQDEFAAASHRKAIVAQEAGKFK